MAKAGSSFLYTGVMFDCFVVVDSFHSCSDKNCANSSAVTLPKLGLAPFVTRRFSSERLSHSNLDNAAAQSQICEEPFNNTYNQCDISQICQLF